MPLLKCQSSKSTPQKVMAYVTDKNKASLISVRNLFEDEDYAEQFEQTAKRFGKGEILKSVNIIISNCLVIGKKYKNAEELFWKD